jgi:hypothetical protein
MKPFQIFSLVLALLPTPALALGGACTAQLDKLQFAFDSQVEVTAAKGPGGAETTDAKLHHQPTPQTIAKAEANIGDKSTGPADDFTYAMKRARDADDDNQEGKCLAALADAKAAFKK